MEIPRVRDYPEKRLPRKSAEMESAAFEGDSMDWDRSRFDGMSKNGSRSGQGATQWFAPLVGGFCAILAVVMICVFSAPEFLARSLEIEVITESSPVSAEWIEKAVAFKPGRESLFWLSLSPIQARLKANPWVEEARLERVPPSTLRVVLEFRKPAYLYQSPQGALQYMDEKGVVFGKVVPSQGVDFPVLSGVAADDLARRQEAILVHQEWIKAVGQDGAKLPGLPTIEQISWNSEQGYRLIVAEDPKLGNYRQKMAVELGPWSPLEFPIQLSRLQSVLKYIRDHQVPVRQIWADAGKKIVVKVGRGS